MPIERQSWHPGGETVLRILIAEDEIVSRQMLEAFLRRWGHEPVIARDLGKFAPESR